MKTYEGYKANGLFSTLMLIKYQIIITKPKLDTVMILIDCTYRNSKVYRYTRKIETQ